MVSGRSSAHARPAPAPDWPTATAAAPTHAVPAESPAWPTGIGAGHGIPLGAPGGVAVLERPAFAPDLDVTAPIPVVVDQPQAVPAAVPAAAPAAAPARPRRAVAVLGHTGRPLRLVLFTVVLALLIGGPAAYAALDKTIQVTVDGAPVTVQTYASTVRGVLSGAEVSVGAEDSVTPALDARIHDGDEIVINRARELLLTVDGKQVNVMVTATSVAEALTQLGYADPSMWVSASRSSRLPLDGAELAIRTPQPFTVTVDGKTQTVHSAESTVGEALDDAGIDVAPTDQLSVPADTPLSPGLAVTVTRIRQDTVTEDRPLPFQVVEQPDPETYVGIKEVVTQGVNGVQEVTVQVTSTDGVETGRTDVSAVVAQAPVDQVVSVGAKEFPADVNALNWDALAHCESTNNPKAVNPNGGYFGLYQFSPATWRSVGGTGLPSDASPEEQLARAKMLYIRSGAGQWECGGHLTD